MKMLKTKIIQGYLDMFDVKNFQWIGIMKDNCNYLYVYSKIGNTRLIEKIDVNGLYSKFTAFENGAEKKEYFEFNQIIQESKVFFQDKEKFINYVKNMEV